MTKKRAILFLLLLLAFMLPLTGLAATSVTVAPGANVTVAPRDRCAGGHTWEPDRVKQPTCTEKGWIIKHCTVCGTSTQEEVAPLGHDYTKIAETAPTCKDSGFVTWQCMRCGHTYTETTKALGHQYGDPKVDIPPTCTEKGRSVRVCKRNESHIWYGEIEALGHDFGEWQTLNGVRTRTCSRCGLTETEQVSPAVLPAETGAGDLPVSGGAPSVAVSMQPVAALDYKEGDRIAAAFTVTNTGPVTIKLLNLYSETGDTVEIQPWMTAEMLPEGSGQGILSILVKHNDVFGYTDFMKRTLTVQCVDLGGNACKAECDLIIPKLKKGASLLLLSQDTTGMTVAESGSYPIRMYCFNNGTIPLRDLNLQSLDTIGNGVAEDSFLGLDADRTLAPGAGKSFQLLLYVRPQDANDGIAWRMVMADAAREDNNGPVGDTTDVAATVDTLFLPPEVPPSPPTIPDPPVTEAPFPESFDPPAVTDPPVTEAPVPAVAVPPEYPEDGTAALQLTVDLAKGCPEEFVPGESVPFEWKLENTGEVPVVYGSTLMSLFVPHEDADDPGFAAEKYEADSRTGVQLIPGQVLEGTFSLAALESEDEDGILCYFQSLAAAANGKNVKSNVEAEIYLLKEIPLTLIKEILSAPKNGSYYTEGEVIRYRITAVNEGRKAADKVVIRDPLSGSSDPLAQVGRLEKGAKLQAEFDYTVTGADVEAGKVLNTAVCEYSYVRRPRQVFSPQVEAPTGKPEKADFCVPVLTGRGTGTAQIELRLCPEHRSDAAKARALLSSGEGEAAAALMSGAVHALYADLYARTGSSAFLEEQAAYDALLEKERACLALTDPSAAWEKTLEALSEKTVDLCYETHTAPSARKDSIFSEEAARLGEAEAEACRRTFEETERGLLIRETLCAKHRETGSFLENAALAAKTRTNRASLLRSARAIWMGELDLLVQRAALTGGEKAEALSALRDALNGYLAAREKTLNVLYPDRQDIIAEVLMTEVKEWTMLLCGDLLK